MLQHLPNEILVRILQVACTEIYNNLRFARPQQRRYRIGGWDYDPGPQFGKKPKPFLNLLLVSQLFYKILRQIVRVNGIQIYQRLTEMQITRFMSTLATEYYFEPLRPDCCDMAPFCPSFTEIESAHGKVWHNPGFPEMLRHIMAYFYVFSWDLRHG